MGCAWILWIERTTACTLVSIYMPVCGSGLKVCCHRVSSRMKVERALPADTTVLSTEYWWYCIWDNVSSAGLSSAGKSWVYSSKFSEGPLMRTGVCFTRRGCESWHFSPWICGGDLVDMYKYLMEGCKDDRARLFLVASSERPRKHKLKCCNLCVNTRKNCSYCAGDQALAQLAEGGFGVSILGGLQNLTGPSLGKPLPADRALSKCVQVEYLQRPLPASSIL